MKLFPLTKNSLALYIGAFTVIGFFTAGMFEVLDYLIVKFLLFTAFGSLLVAAIGFAIKNDTKKNHPEEKPQDDLH